MRDAYVSAQTRVKIARQIKALRMQRGWSQSELGKRLGKPQSNISRLEDTQGTKYTLSTLFEIAAVFDVAVSAEFVSYPDFLVRTADLSPEHLQVGSFNRAELDPLTKECGDAPDSPHSLSGMVPRAPHEQVPNPSLSAVGGTMIVSIGGAGIQPLPGLAACAGQSVPLMTQASPQRPSELSQGVPPLTPSYTAQNRGAPCQWKCEGDHPQSLGRGHQLSGSPLWTQDQNQILSTVQ